MPARTFACCMPTRPIQTSSTPAVGSCIQESANLCVFMTQVYPEGTLLAEVCSENCIRSRQSVAFGCIEASATAIDTR